MSDERGRVLVVDDDADLRAMLQRILSRQHDVTLAENAATALALLEARDFDVAVLDVMMPGGSGVEVCRAVRARKNSSYVGVLLLTALDDKASRMAGFEAGADDYLAKPFDRAELELRVAHFVRLAQQERLIRKQVEQLRELAALKDDLAALIVHDLRNPLAGAMAALEFIEGDPKDERVREMARLGRAGGQQVMDATKDILQIRMLENGKLPLDRSLASLGGIVRGAVEAVKLVAEAQEVEVRVSVEHDVQARVDGKLLRRALENLLANAIRHTKKDVDVVLTSTSGRAIIFVGDRGAGVPDELKSGLFQQFGSVKLQQSGARRGHGLGLYLVRLVAQAHGGDVDVDDREGGGASFRLVLPLDDA